MESEFIAAGENNDSSQSSLYEKIAQALRTEFPETPRTGKQVQSKWDSVCSQIRVFSFFSFVY